jgi:hypothetical protein
VTDEWDQAVAAARGMFAMSLSLSYQPEPSTEREHALVDLALQSGVLGTFAVMREKHMRVLVTGSRDWTDREAIARWLAPYLRPGNVLVHGHCPTGADAIADDIWQAAGLGVPERHPADWNQGRGAGPRRNMEMVRLGADVCGAFIGPCTSKRCRISTPHDSHGAAGCALLAEKAGITVERIRPRSL